VGGQSKGSASVPQKIKIKKAENNHAYQNRRIEKTKEKTKNLPKLQTVKPKLIKGTGAGKIWDRISPYLRKSDMVKNADLTTIVMLCTEIEIYQRAYKNILDKDIQQPIYRTVQDASGKKIGTDYCGDKKNPAVNTMDAAIRQIRGLCSDLGLTPASRAKLISLATDDEDGGPSLDELLNNAGDDF